MPSAWASLWATGWATGWAGGRIIRSRVDQLQLAERRAGDEHSAGAGVNGHRVRLAHGGQPSDHPGRWVAEVDPGHLVGGGQRHPGNVTGGVVGHLSLIHISEPTRLLSNSYAVFCL